jgi:hypothetical protein
MKKGDIFDGIMWSHGKALENPYSMVLEDFPVDVREVIENFLKLWKFPIEKIPSNKSKWIIDAREIYHLSPKKYKRCLDRTFKTHQESPFTILGIGSILNLYKNCLEQINSEDKEKEEKFRKAMKVEEAEDPVARKKAIAEMRRKLRGEDNENLE